MGIYDKNKYNLKEDPNDKAPIIIDRLVDIANELHEGNRLKRLELEMLFRSQSNRALYRTFEHDGKKITVPPQEKEKADWKEEQKAITKELKDQAVTD